MMNAGSRVGSACTAAAVAFLSIAYLLPRFPPAPRTRRGASTVPPFAGSRTTDRRRLPARRPPPPSFAHLNSKSQGDHPHPSHHHHITPTVLSVYDDDAPHGNADAGGLGSYVNALSNPLYEELKGANFVTITGGSSLGDDGTTRRRDVSDDDNDNDDGHHHRHPDHPNLIIYADKRELSFHDSLAVSWRTAHGGDDVDSNDHGGASPPMIISDDDVIAMYCPATESDPTKFRDAATVRQARATSARHGHGAAVAPSAHQRGGQNSGGNDGGLLLLGDGPKISVQRRRRMAPGGTAAAAAATVDTDGRDGPYYETWIIPSFPIIREPTCEFRLWRRSSSGGFGNDGNTTRSRLGSGGSGASGSGVLPAAAPSTSTLSLAGTTGPITLKLSHLIPTAIHLALTSDPTEMTVHFTTGSAGTPVVMYGERSGTGGSTDLPDKVTGTSTTYAAADMCQEPANLTEPGKFISPGQLHNVRLTQLHPDTEYSYKVGLASGQGIVWSDVYTFRSALPAGCTEPHAFVVYGDQGTPASGDPGGNSTSVLVGRELLELGHDDGGSGNGSSPTTTRAKVRSVHHFGDLSYARGSAYLWDAWLAEVQIFATAIPLMVGVGNHEYDHTAGGDDGRDPSGVNTSHGYMPPWGNFGQDSGGECGVPTARRFVVPTNGNGVFWYSFDYGLVHTVMVSSEHDLSFGSVQHTWLERDLRGVNRTQTPWVVVESHRPMYHPLPYWSDNAVGIAMRNELEDLLVGHDVDVFLAGHYHSYLRTCTGLYRSKCGVRGGPVHITVGTAGANLDDGVPYEQEWTERFLLEWGYGRVTVANESAMHFEFVGVGDGNGTVMDEVWIRR